MNQLHRKRLLVKLRLSQDKLRQEDLRLKAIAQANSPEADRRKPTSATERAIADKVPAIDAAKTERVKGDVQMVGVTDDDVNAETYVPIQRKARMKKTPANAIRKRHREDAQAEAYFQEKLKENRAIDEAEQEEIRRKEENFIKKDLARRKTARQIEECLQLHYHWSLG